MSAKNIYAEPLVITNLNDCYFYHTMDIPGFGTVEGEWDLRPGVNQYFGNADFSGKRVLEIGTSSGFGCFTMERWGAEVVAFDLSPEHSWDVVPFHDLDYRQHIQNMKNWYRKQNNGFWLCHRAFHSKTKMVYGTVYDIPLEIGMVDISTFCAVLLHFRDPFFALQNAAKLTKKTLIITDVIPVLILKDKPSQIVFRPALRLKQKADYSTWWYLPPETIVDFIGVLGFEDVKISYHQQLWNNKDAKEYITLPFYTVVGHRK
jgi:hypothetical protein